MSEMIERVARAIIRARHRTCCKSRAITDFPVSDHEMNEARAAIEAMRGPAPKVSTAVMVAAGKMASTYGDQAEVYIRADAGEFIVAAMIDEALRDGIAGEKRA